MTEPLRKHAFRPGRWRDPYRRQICEECGSIRDARIHKLPDRDEDEKATEARKVGETVEP